MFRPALMGLNKNWLARTFYPGTPRRYVLALQGKTRREMEPPPSMAATWSFGNWFLGSEALRGAWTTTVHLRFNL